MTGVVYGGLELLGESVAPRHSWTCCVYCGREGSADTTQMKREHFEDCGCGCGNSRVGQRFDRLVVLPDPPPPEWSRLFVVRKACICRCDCGRVVWIRKHNLKPEGRGTGSCGCKWRSVLSIEDEAALAVFRSYRHRAKEKGRPFNLTLDHFAYLIEQPCYLCKRSVAEDPRANTFPSNHGRTHRYHGLDRVDSRGGYTPDNVEPCCAPCNYAKGDRPLEVYLARRH